MQGSDRADGPHVLLAGGGTGGHVFPGLAVGEELRRRGWSVSWVGRGGGLEERLVRARDVPYHSLPARALVGRSTAARAGALATLSASAWRARRLIERLDARAVLGTGGFVSAPAVVGARLARRPVVLVEPNAAAGTANRWLSRWARAAALALPSAARGLRCPVEITGVPVRDEFFEPREMPPASPPRVLVLGGSLGAQQLNRLLPPALERLAAAGLAARVLHQVGEGRRREAERDYAERRLGGVTVEVTPFLDDVAGAMGGAHLIVSRAGAGTLAELCAVGRAALLVPLALAGGHQRDNARALVAAGGARMIAPEEATAEGLAAALAELLAGDGERLRAMGAAMAKLARPGAAAAIADLVERVAGVAA